jgi:hypothetical protein
MVTTDSADPSPEMNSLVNVLLPNRTDEPLDELAYVVFIDNGTDVAVSGVDLLLMAITRNMVADSTFGQTVLIQLPRARHRSALLLAITSHLICRQAPVYFSGPVVLIALDVDLSEQLRNLAVRGHRRMKLLPGNPLSAHRLTREGEAQPLIGTDARPIDRSLIYFNTRVGQPELASQPPLVILDSTSVTSPAARVRALQWALDRGAAGIVVIGDLGDDGPVESMTLLGLVPTVFSLTSSVAADLVADFSRGDAPDSTLSSMPMLGPRTGVVLHKVAGDEINNAIAKAFQAIATKPSGPIPHQLQTPVNLLRNGARLAARVADYKRACAFNPRPGELASVIWLSRMDPQLPKEWNSWKTARWGGLRNAVTSLWQALETDTPKLKSLWSVLDGMDRDTEGPILIRAHSRAAALATQSSLSSGDRTPVQVEVWDRISGRVMFSTFKDRFPAGAFEAQVLTGAPPPWLLSLLLGVEAEVTHVLLYEAEEASLRRQSDAWASTLTGWQQAACRTLGAAPEAAQKTPLPDPSPVELVRARSRLELPGLSLADVLDAAAQAMDPEEEGASAAVLAAGSSTKRCIPITLDDGRTWWCEADDGEGRPVVVVTAGGHENRLARELRPGDHVIVPAGEGTDSIHARLVALSRGNDDVKSLDLILGQFRAAARSLMDGRSRSDAIDMVRRAGAEASDQLPNWAKGTTIAPRNPEDVAAVFRAAARPQPDLGLIYAVAGALRNLNQMLGKFVAAITRGQGDAAVVKLRQVVGDVALELVDEFVLATVHEVGTAQEVLSSLAGTVR